MRKGVRIMSDMEIGKHGAFQRMNSFLKREISGEPKKEEEGTWSGSTLDYVTKGGVTGGLVGAGLGALADKLSQQKEVTVKYQVPVMETTKIGEIPKNHVAVNPDIGDPAYIRPDGKPVPGTGVAVEGVVPKRTLLGGFVMEEKTATAARQSNSLISNVLGGIIVGTISGAVAGVALKILNSIIHPPQNNIPWQRSAPPDWNNSSTSQPWSRSAPDWSNSSSPQPWSNSSPGWNNSSSPPDWSNSGSPGSWSKSTPQPWSNTHSKAPYSNTHSNAHSNYGDAHSNYSNTHSNAHSNYSNSHSNAWDRHVSY